MRKLILLGFLIISILATGCTIGTEAAQSSAPVGTEDVSNSPQKLNLSDNSGKKELLASPKMIEENLKEIEYPNLNSENNQIITMPLKDGWTAKKITWEKPKDYEYKETKNKSITESFEYYIYNEKKDEIGWFGIISNYSDDSDILSHMQYKDLRYKGMTKLGKGKIYLVKPDIPKSEDSADNNHLYEYYSIIPVQSEKLAYSFNLKVLDKDKTKDILETMKKIIVTNDDIELLVHELYLGKETMPENTEKIIKLIPNIDWIKYESKYPNEYTKLIAWIGNLDVSNPDYMANILNATNGLDGWYTDEYCNAVKKQLFNNKDVFLKALLKIDDDQIKVISSYVHYACDKDEAIKVREYFGHISETDNGTAKEADRAKQFLDAFK